MTSQLLLGLGGVIALIGSFMAWASFSLFDSFLIKTGIELGYGVVSALLSIGAIASTILSGRAARRALLLSVLASLGILGVAAVAALALSSGLPGLEFHRYRLGLAVTAIGGGIACLGAALRRRGSRV